MEAEFGSPVALNVFIPGRHLEFSFERQSRSTLEFLSQGFSTDSTFEGTIKPALGMETILSSSSAPSWRQHSLQGSRKFLHTQVRKDFPSVSTRPPAPTEGCQNTKTGVFTICQQPPKLIIIFAGMGCMLFIIIIAIVLLLYSFRRHRCQRPENSHEDHADGPTCCSGDQRIHEGTDDCGDVVLVQLPGVDIPQFFARPSPFTAMSKSQEVTIDKGDKTLDVSDCSGDSEPTHNPNCIVHQPVATNNDGTHRNFLLPGSCEA